VGGASNIYELTPDQYLIDGSEFDRPGTCFLGILGAQLTNEYIFGSSFLMWYYVVYDQDNRQISLGRSSFSSAMELVVSGAIAFLALAGLF